MIVPIVIGITALAAIKSKKKEVVPVDAKTAAERRVVYEAALACKDTSKLKAISKVFRDEGCIVEADMLDKRVALREAPADIKAQRKEALRKGLACQDPSKVRELADAFDEIGTTGASAILNRYATGLENVQHMDAEGMTNGEE